MQSNELSSKHQSASTYNKQQIHRRRTGALKNEGVDAMIRPHDTQERWKMSARVEVILAVLRSDFLVTLKLFSWEILNLGCLSLTLV